MAHAVTSLAVVTPSYAPDFELCSDLHASVLRWGPVDLVHHIVVPRTDLRRFRQLQGPRCRVWPVDAFLPRYVRRVPGLNLWVNIRRPWPPVRGWIMQQVVKMGAVTKIEADVLLFVDSDIEFVRPFSLHSYQRQGRPLLHRIPAAVDASLPEHVVWHEAARRILGVAPRPLPLPDYISPVNVWERSTALGLLDRIAEVNARPWADVLCGTLHLSEFILYGVYVEDVLGAADPDFTTPVMRCHNYWGTEPLDQEAARQFMASLPDGDVAVMISAKSHTPRDVRRAALDHLPRGGRAPTDTR